MTGSETEPAGRPARPGIDLPPAADEAERAEFARGRAILAGLADSLPPLSGGVLLPIPPISSGGETDR